MRGLCVSTIIAVSACSGRGSEPDEPDAPGDSDVPADSAADSPSTPELLGCQDPANWICGEPSPGFEYGCQAVCEDRIVATCNQQYDGGVCIIEAAGQGDACGVPQDVQGCEICYDAVLLPDCAALIATFER